MKLWVLTENHASGKFQAEHGLSYLIEHDKKLLFDVGHSDIFLKNAEKMGLDLKDIDTIVLSHGHWDHGDGLRYVSGKKLICHPSAFMNRKRKNNGGFVGLKLNGKQLSEKFQLIEKEGIYKITENIVFLGEIPRVNSFESKFTNFTDENGVDDFVPDDTGLVLIDGDEIVVISGCSHSGICNIIDYAVKITGIGKIRTVIGGFHLKIRDEQTLETIKCLEKHKIKNLYPSHCTELPVLSLLYEKFKIKQVKTGQVIRL